MPEPTSHDFKPWWQWAQVEEWSFLQNKNKTRDREDTSRLYYSLAPERPTGLLGPNPNDSPWHAPLSSLVRGDSNNSHGSEEDSKR